MKKLKMKQQTKTNNIEWKEVEFGNAEYFEVKKGESITKDKVSEGNVPVVAGGQQPAYYHNKSNRLGETITISGSGAYAGFVNYFEIPIFASDCSTVQSKSKSVLTKYIYLFLKSYQKRIYLLQKGIAQPHVYPKDIAKIKIPLPFFNGKPDLKEQERIVSILEKAEKLKERGENAETLLDEYLKSIFNEMFYNKGFEEVELGNENLFKIKGGKRLPLGERFSEKKTNRPYLRVTDMRNKTILKEDIKYISESTFDKIKNYTISSEDVYITIAGTIGFSGTIPKEFDGASLTENSAKIIILNKNKVSKLFLANILASDYVQNQIKSRIGAVGVPKLALFRIATLKIPLPPIPLQQTFSNIVEQVEKMKENVKKTKANSEELFNSLMQKAFRGEL